MKYIFFLIILSIFFSCGKEKVILLPEIDHSEISEIKDVSPAYLFYDETKADSVELNRKNLISTTNWLVNVDKRLTLKQVIPHIKFLQEKKKNSSHKNENAKNYFTCNDISRKNLGFIEFTDVIFKSDNLKPKQVSYDEYIGITAYSSDSLNFSYSTIDSTKLDRFHKKNILKGIKSNLIKDGNVITFLMFDKNLKFQDYITIKSKLSQLDSKNITISKDEFIFN